MTGGEKSPFYVLREMGGRQTERERGSKLMCMKRSSKSIKFQMMRTLPSVLVSCIVIIMTGTKVHEGGRK